ncbi:hypothetical protein [Cohnella mopanensis]|uniref:hypothetical protein n=1 Tax=Cohnella mopanensis TaxID=2911966 RepID=UPI001EF7F465|nr:hypothetical protein [Cohnella mopanensis]
MKIIEHIKGFSLTLLSIALILSIFSTIDYFRYVKYLNGKPIYREEQTSKLFVGMSKDEVKSVMGSIGYDISADSPPGIEKKEYVSKLTFEGVMFGVPRLILVYENNSLVQAQYTEKKIETLPRRRSSSRGESIECVPSPCI